MVTVGRGGEVAGTVTPVGAGQVLFLDLVAG